MCACPVSNSCGACRLSDLAPLATIGCRSLKNADGKTPQSFASELAEALGNKFKSKSCQLLSVMDWAGFLRPHLRTTTTGIQHFDLDAEPGNPVCGMPI